MSRLTVLGSCGAWPEAGRACSGFLLEHEGFRVVLDLGFGTLPRLLEHCPDGVVDAVIVTHEHSDHCVDLNGLSRVRFFDPNRAGAGRIPLHCTPGVVERVDQLEPDGSLDEIFEVHDLAGSCDLGPFHLETVALPHHVPNRGVRLTAPNLTVAYTGDTGPDPGLAVLGRGADLFVVEASHQGPPRTTGPRLLMTAQEAGEWAAHAAAKRLMLTHFWPGNDRARSVAEARERFSGDVLAADEGLTIDLA